MAEQHKNFEKDLAE
jgi:hypothetical protein